MSAHTCPICFKKVGNQDCTVTACNHVFHFTCLCKNFKYNYNTGDRCPVCRKSFLSSQAVVKVNPIINRVRSVLFPANGPIPRPPPAPIAPLFRPTLVSRPVHLNRGVQINRNTIVHSRRVQRITQVNNVEAERIKQYITDLSFDELKSKLKEKGVSSRGYLRDSLEKRLYRAMRR